MITQKIFNNNKEYFKTLFSKEKYDLIDAYNTVTIGALDDKLAPLGTLMIKLVSDNKCQLIWLYVKEEKRRKGVATFLWTTLKNVLIKLGFNSVSYMATNYDFDNGIWDFCVSINGQKYNTEYIIPTFQAKSAYPHFSNYSSNNIESLSKLSAPNFLEALDRLGKKTPLYQMMPNLWSDRQLIQKNSFGRFSNATINSLALCIPNETDNGLIVFDINCSNKADFFYLIKAVCKHAIDTYGEDALISLYTLKGVELEITSRYGGQASILYLYPCLLPLNN